MCEVVHMLQKQKKLLLFLDPVSQPVIKAHQNLCKQANQPHISATLSSHSSFDVDKHAAARLALPVGAEWRAVKSSSRKHLDMKQIAAIAA